MNVLYYSNYCPYSKQVVSFISKSGLIDKVNAICIDKRRVNPRTGQTEVELQNGQKILLPPNIHSVPAMLIVKNNYQAIFGGDIISHLEPFVIKSIEKLTNGEPMGASVTNSMSDKFTSYNMGPNELNPLSMSSQKELNGFASSSYDSHVIYTPQDNYKPDKVSSNMTIEDLEKQRNLDLGISAVPKSPFGF